MRATAEAAPESVDDLSALEQLRPKQRARLEGISSVQRLPGRDRVIYHQGQPADALYFLEFGMVELSCQRRDGGRHIVSFLHPGDVFGLAEHERYINTARTLAPTKLYRVPIENLRRLLLEDGQLQLHFLARAAHDLRKAQRQMIILGQHDIHCRLASFLLEFQRSNQFYDPDTRLVSLPVNRQDIADYLALTQESVSRALTRMERAGLIRRLSRKAICLEDLRGLIALAVR